MTRSALSTLSEWRPPAAPDPVSSDGPAPGQSPLRLGRRSFVQQIARGAMAGAFAAHPLLRGLLLSGRTPSLAPRSAASRARPFHMVVLGDSVAWGQGLRDADKYSTLVAQWLEQQLGRPVASWMFAHSGAVIGPDPSDSSAPLLPQEVPTNCPSVMAQLGGVAGYFANHPPIDAVHDAPVTTREVGLVLVDGGINDVNVRDILTMDPSILRPERWIRGLARERCVERIGQVLLPEVLAAFPNAQVVVTGYYAIVSEDSRLGDLERFLHDLGVVGLPADAGIDELVRKKLAGQCSAFCDETTRGLRDVVPQAEPLRVVASSSSSASGARTAGPVLATPQGTTRQAPHRAHFVDCGLTASQAFGASDTVLWGVPASDPIAGEREQDCRALGGSPEYLMCLEASAGHPNRDGARLIAARITRTLECVLVHPSTMAGVSIRPNRGCLLP